MNKLLFCLTLGMAVAPVLSDESTEAWKDEQKKKSSHSWVIWENRDVEGGLNVPPPGIPVLLWAPDGSNKVTLYLAEWIEGDGWHTYVGGKSGTVKIETNSSMRDKWKWKFVAPPKGWKE